MISDRAKTGFNSMLQRSLDETLKSEAHPTWTLKSAVKAVDILAPHGIMLTISSYSFRLIVVLHFSSSKASMRYVADTLRIGSGELAKARYDDFVSEISNNFCGVIKRELSTYFPHLGMSTPNRLDKESLKHVKAWPIDHESHVKAQNDDGAEFFGSLFVSSFGDLDFDPKSVAVEDEVDSGALEMF